MQKNQNLSFSLMSTTLRGTLLVAILSLCVQAQAATRSKYYDGASTKDETPVEAKSSLKGEVDKSMNPNPSIWSGSVGFGTALSQLITTDQPGKPGGVVDSAFQMNLNLTAERFIYADVIGFQTGLTLGAQFVKTAPSATSTTSAGNSDRSLAIRYVSVPAMSIFHIGRTFSLGAGGFFIVPLAEGDSDYKLKAAEIGLKGSAQALFPATANMDWVVETSLERGLVHVFNNSPNDIRNISLVAGIAAHL